MERHHFRPGGWPINLFVTVFLNRCFGRSPSSRVATRARSWLHVAGSPTKRQPGSKVWIEQLVPISGAGSHMRALVTAVEHLRAGAEVD